MSRVLVMFGYENVFEYRYHWHDSMTNALARVIEEEKKDYELPQVVRIFEDYYLMNPYETIKSFEDMNKWINKLLGWFNLKGDKKRVARFRYWYDMLATNRAEEKEHYAMIQLAQDINSKGLLIGMIGDTTILDSNKIAAVSAKAHSTYNYYSFNTGLTKDRDGENLLRKVMRESGRTPREILVIDANKQFCDCAEELGCFTYWDDCQYIGNIRAAVDIFATGRLYGR